MHRLRTGSGWQWLVCASLLMSAFVVRGNAEAAATYVGAAVCGSGCHLGKHEGWLETAHQQILMDGGAEASYINDANQSGRSEFFDGGAFPITSLPHDVAFDAFGANAPILGRNAKLGPYVQIGTARYAIAYTLGGSAVQNPTVADTPPPAGLGDGDGLVLNREAQWKQLYITKIGPSHYVLPIQFNAKTGEYVPYNTSEWYDQANVPIAKAALRIAETSYERRCAGCHSTGVKIGRNPTSGLWNMSFTDMNVACEACHGPGSDHVYNAPTVELKKATIVNPATLLARSDLNGDGTRNMVDHLIAQNSVCYQCHQQGTGLFGTGDEALLYPSKAAPNGNPVLYRPGQDLRDYFTVTQTRSDYWGAEDKNGNGLIDIVAHDEDLNRNGVLDPSEDLNGNGVLDRKEFIAAASSQMQGVEHAGGPHAADKAYDHPCFSCHDMHNADRLHLLVSENEGVPVPQPGDSTVRRNNLCLSCHATHGDFAALTQDDLISGSANITTVVRAHVKNRAFMDVGFQTRCISCHMVPTAKSAIEPDWVYDAREGGWIEVRGGDLHSHSFEPIWPGFVMQPPEFQWTDFLPWWESSESFDDPLDGSGPHVAVGPMPDSCTSCHAHDPNVPENDNIVTQWAKSGHGDGFAEPWNHWNADPSVSSSCSRCHSAYGYRQLADSSTSTDPAKPTPQGVPWYTLDANGINPTYNTVTSQSPVYPKVLNCEGCHEPNGGGLTLYQAGKLQEVAFPSGVRKTLGNSSNVCMQCHQGRQSGKSIPSCSATTGNCSVPSEHYLPEAATFWGTEVTAGYEYEGMTYQGKNVFAGHEQVERQDCIGCHLYTTNQETGGVKKDHDFRPNMEDCSSCHAGEDDFPLEDFEDLGKPFGYSNVDYDGDGAAESFRHEMDGLMDKLVLALNIHAKLVGRPPLMFVEGQTRLSLVTNGCYIQDGCIPESVPIPPSTTPPSYSAYDLQMVKGAYNWNAARDRAAAIHNHKYIIQTMYDSIVDLGGSPAGLIRP